LLFVIVVMLILSIADSVILDYVFDYRKETSNTVTPMNVNPFVTGLSIVLGIYAFGFNGFVIGPLLVFLTIIAYDIFAEKIVTNNKTKK